VALKLGQRAFPQVRDVRYWHITDIDAAAELSSKADVRLWHKADMLNALTNVRFWEQSGH
jgi:hypothetical protein